MAHRLQLHGLAADIRATGLADAVETAKGNAPASEHPLIEAVAEFVHYALGSTDPLATVHVLASVRGPADAQTVSVSIRPTPSAATAKPAPTGPRWEPGTGPLARGGRTG